MGGTRLNSCTAQRLEAVARGVFQVRQAATRVVSGQIDGRRGEVGVPHLVLDVLNVNPISEGVSCVGMSDSTKKSRDFTAEHAESAEIQ